MRKNRPTFLVAQSFDSREEFEPLKRYAEVHWLDDLDAEERARTLPLVDAVYAHGWPKSLDAEAISKMKRLRFVQTGNAGVNTFPFRAFDERVVLCSNAGAYSDDVAEFAIGLMLGAGKCILSFDRQLRAGSYVRKRSDDMGRQVALFKGKTLGIVGYGGIGRSTAGIAKAMGMEILAFGRHPIRERGVRSLMGRKGLMELLERSDVVVLAIPLTKATKGMIGSKELAAMKRDAILVNVARGEVVQKEAVYEHLVKNPGFVFATDVWWPGKDGFESYSPDLPFLELKNFIGSPHASGPSAIVSGTVGKAAVENLSRYFQGRRVRNVVDRSEYV